MEKDLINITDIKPADYNPRMISSGDYEKLTQSIKTFGLVDPIIINLNDNTVIGGHQRYDVLMDMYMDNEIDKELSLLKLGDIGWVFTNDQLNVKDENFEKALNLSLNKISGEWDEDKLAVVLEDLEVSGFDVTLTGFDSEEVKKMTFVESKDEFDELAGFSDYDEKYGDKEENNNEKVYFKLVLMLSSEKEQEELYLQLQEEGYDCQILTY
jgi:hypothetical protein